MCVRIPFPPHCVQTSNAIKCRFYNVSNAYIYAAHLTGLLPKSERRAMAMETKVCVKKKLNSHIFNGKMGIAGLSFRTNISFLQNILSARFSSFHYNIYNPYHVGRISYQMLKTRMKIFRLNSVSRKSHNFLLNGHCV